MDEVFKAINDPSRRLLLDKLFDSDGQTLGELCSHLPEMTRYGVMNHLKVLEAAGVVTTLKQGRSKLHYLNPVPIRLIHDRWINKYAESRVGAITDIKARVEGGGRRMGAPDRHTSTAPRLTSGTPSSTPTRPFSTSTGRSSMSTSRPAER
jgi:DNA-binding transcriptional ArsR family regulator